MEDSVPETLPILRAEYVETPEIKGPFTPSNQQQRYAMIHLGSKSPTEIQRTLKSEGFTDEKIQTWFSNDDFAEWFHNSSVRYMQYGLWEIYGAMRKQALRGKVAAQKLYLERFDKTHQATMGKIDLAVRSMAAPVSNEQVVKALVKQLKTDPDFKAQLQEELELEGETIGKD